MVRLWHDHISCLPSYLMKARTTQLRVNLSSWLFFSLSLFLTLVFTSFFLVFGIFICNCIFEKVFKILFILILKNFYCSFF